MPRLLLLLTVIIWGWSFVATKIALAYVNPVELLGLRLLIGVPCLFAIAAAKRIRLHFSFREQIQLLVACLIISAHFLVQITGLKYTSATNTGWLIAVSPLALLVLSHFSLKERVGMREGIGMLIATGGVLLLVSRGHLSDLNWLSNIGDWLVLASAFTWALYTVATRDLSRAHDPIAVTIAVLLPTTFLCVGYMTIASDWSRLIVMPAKGVVAILSLGVLAMALGQWFWQIGIGKIGAARAGVFLYLEPVATSTLAVPYLGEPFGFTTAIGGILVLAGVFCASGSKTAKGSSSTAQTDEHRDPPL